MILINSSSGDSLKIFQPFLPIYVPVGIGYLIATLKQNGIECVCVDEQIEDNVFDKIESLVENISPPYIFGFSVLTASFKNALDLSLKLKNRFPECKILFGGIHPTAMPDEVLSFKHIDYVVRGEAENIITDLFNCLKAGEEPISIESVSYRKDNEIVHNKRAVGVEDLNTLPLFPYESFENKKYDLGFVMSSRGCPYNCSFCSNKINSQRKFRFFDPQRVVDELTLLHNKYNRKYVYFLDDNLLANKERIIKLSKLIQESSIQGKMIFNFQARGDNVDEETLRFLFDVGFKGVYYGIETASEELMQAINKGETVQEVITAIEISKKIGYHVSANFIFGLPGETHKDRMDAIDLTKKMKVDLVKYNNATPYPGTELYNLALETNRIRIKGCYENFNSVSTFIENPFNKIPFAYIPERNSEEEIRDDILMGYLKFYTNFRKIKGVFISPDLNNGWFDFGHSLVDFFKKLPAIVFLIFILIIKFSDFLIRYMISKISKK